MRPGTGFAQWESALPLLGLSYWLHSFQVPSPAPLARWSQEPVPSVGSYDLAPCLSISKPWSRTSKTSHLRTWTEQIYTPTNFLVRENHQLGSVNEQNHWLVLLIRHWRYEFDLLISIRWLLQGPSQFTTTLRFPVCKPTSVRQDQIRGSHKATHNIGGLEAPRLSFPLEELEAHRRPLHVMLHWPGQVWQCS